MVFLDMTPSYFTDTFTCAFDQQHWKPRPPSPDQSLATTRNTYSPGSLKVAAVTALPWNEVFGGAAKLASSTAGLSLEKVTGPGPRNLLHVSVAAGVRGRVAPGITLASSATQSGSVNGSFTFAVSDKLCPLGP